MLAGCAVYVRETRPKVWPWHIEDALGGSKNVFLVLEPPKAQGQCQMICQMNF